MMNEIWSTNHDEGEIPSLFSKHIFEMENENRKWVSYGAKIIFRLGSLRPRHGILRRRSIENGQLFPISEWFLRSIFFWNARFSNRYFRGSLLILWSKCTTKYGDIKMILCQSRRNTRIIIMVVRVRACAFENISDSPRINLFLF